MGRGEGAALASVMALAAGLRLWRLDRAGFGHDYYSAGVRSQLESWHNFLYNAADPAGFASLDKPPLAYWIQVASAKLFGFSGPAVVLPQVIEGLLSILLLHHLVRRSFGATAGVLAALFFALTPISVAVDRTSIGDSLMLLLLLLAFWAFTRAAESGRFAPLAGAMALMGLAFNAKLLAAFVPLPALVLGYAVAAAIPRPRRLAYLAAGGVVLAVTSLAWIAFYDTTPPDERPRVSFTTGNTMRELAFDRIGFNRLTAAATPPQPLRPFPAQLGTSRTSPYYDNQPVGPFRLLDRRLAGQALWLLPLALLGLAMAAAATGPARLQLLLWGGWLALYGAVYSYDAGAFHAYYLMTLAPPLSALAAVGIVRARWWALAAGLLATAAWQAYVSYGYLPAMADRGLWLMVGVSIAVLAAAGGLAAGYRRSATMVGVAALLATPLAWALSNVLLRGNQMIPSASIARLAGQEDNPIGRWSSGWGVATDDERLFAFLRAHHDGERFALAAPNARLTAPIIIHTGLPVMAWGGFLGTDPGFAVDDLARLVEAGEVRFVLLAAERGAHVSPIAAWVMANGRPVDPALWRGMPRLLDEDDRPDRPRSGNYARLFDLKPGARLAAE